MPLKPSHNLLVRGSNPCGGTNVIADFRFPIADFLLGEFSEASGQATMGEDGATRGS
jgi:hypothetical protein